MTTSTSTISDSFNDSTKRQKGENCNACLRGRSSIVSYWSRDNDSSTCAPAPLLCLSLSVHHTTLTHSPWSLHASLTTQINQYNAWHDICEPRMTYITFSFWNVPQYFSLALFFSFCLDVYVAKMWQFFNCDQQQQQQRQHVFLAVSVWLLDCCLSQPQVRRHTCSCSMLAHSLLHTNYVLECNLYCTRPMSIRWDGWHWQWHWHWLLKRIRPSDHRKIPI